MNEIIRILFVVFFAVFCLITSINQSTYSRSTMYLKEDLDIAVHDASLALDLQSLSEGILKFNEAKAIENFNKSIYLNTDMGVEDFIVIDFQFFDHSNTTFPIEYEPSNVNFKDVFYSPTIVAIIETDTQKFFTNAEYNPVRNVASYSYNVN